MAAPRLFTHGHGSLPKSRRPGLGQNSIDEWNCSGALPVARGDARPAPGGRCGYACSDRCRPAPVRVPGEPARAAMAQRSRPDAAGRGRYHVAPAASGRWQPALAGPIRRARRAVAQRSDSVTAGSSCRRTLAVAAVASRAAARSISLPLLAGHRQVIAGRCWRAARDGGPRCSGSRSNERAWSTAQPAMPRSRRALRHRRRRARLDRPVACLTVEIKPAAAAGTADPRAATRPAAPSYFDDARLPLRRARTACARCSPTLRSTDVSARHGWQRALAGCSAEGVRAARRQAGDAPIAFGVVRLRRRRRGNRCTASSGGAGHHAARCARQRSWVHDRGDGPWYARGAHVEDDGSGLRIDRLTTTARTRRCVRSCASAPNWRRVDWPRGPRGSLGVPMARWALPRAAPLDSAGALDAVNAPHERQRAVAWRVLDRRLPVNQTRATPRRRADASSTTDSLCRTGLTGPLRQRAGMDVVWLSDPEQDRCAARKRPDLLRLDLRHRRWTDSRCCSASAPRGLDTPTVIRR